MLLPSPISGAGGDRRSTTAFQPYTHTHQPSTPVRSMEEVWKDINLPCLHDFLNRPSSDHQPSVAAVSAAVPAAVPAAVAPIPIPATVLSLNSGPELYFPSDVHHHHHDGHSTSGHLVIAGDVAGDHFQSFDALASSVLASFGTKKLAEAAPVDRRHKRMIKNRESAARSRARKQAYLNTLQMEIDNLKEENAKLKEQHKKKQKMMEDECNHLSPKEYLLQRVRVEPVLCKLPKEHRIHRTLTAPF